MGLFSSVRALVDRLIDPPSRAPVRVARAVPAAPVPLRAAPPPPTPADRRLAIHRGFAAALPVEDRFGLSGRQREIDAMVSGVVLERKHVVVYGLRGSGKTSLVRVFGDFADEVGNIVLYESTSGNIGFADLFRPFLDTLPGLERDAALAARVATMQAGSFGVRDLATVLGEIRQPTVLVLDEFDRIDDVAVQMEVAALLKLVSDMHAKVQIVLVGIAANVDDLIAGHPSLRRHMLVVPVGPIAGDAIGTLLDGCARKSGMAFAPDAVATVSHLAGGSPYHARLFGVKSALAADARGSNRIEQADVAEGTRAALADWAEMNGADYRLFRAVAADPAEHRGLLALVDRMTTGFHAAATGMDPAAERAAERLAPALLVNAHGGMMFRDSLAAQFLALIVEEEGARGSGRDTVRGEGDSK